MLLVTSGMQEMGVLNGSFVLEDIIFFALLYGGRILWWMTSNMLQDCQTCDVNAHFSAYTSK